MNSTLRISALVAATAMLAACGGGGDSQPTPPTTGGGGSNNPPPVVPVNDAEQYKGYLEASLRHVLGIDQAAKKLSLVPANIKTEVEAHGPTQQCNHSACPPIDTSTFVTFPYADGGTVRLTDWYDAPTGLPGPNTPAPTDGQFAGNDSVSVDLEVISSAPAITASVKLRPSTEATGPLFVQLVPNYEATRQGMRLNGSARVEYRGSLFIAKDAGKVTITDHVAGNPVGRELIVEEMNAQGVRTNSFSTNYTATSNVADQDAVVFDFDGKSLLDGSELKVKSAAGLNFIALNGKTQIESGTFTYEFKGSQTFNLRVAVDADPAFLNVEIDANADGAYEKSGRLPQDSFDFNF